jgi:SAM-dependent methyltransferase
MKGSIPTKIARVVSNLVVHPNYIPRTFRHNVVNGVSPLDLEVPWFSYAANDYLSQWLKPEMTAFEYGSGGSTLFLAKHVKSVRSVEDNPKWFELVSKRLQEKHIGNATLEFHQFDFKNPTGFEHSEYLNSLNQEYDVIFIDGSEEWNLVRPLCFQHAEKFVRPGGIIVVDDSWRYPELHKQNKAKYFKIFKSVGPCRPGVTSTDVFFY